MKVTKVKASLVEELMLKVDLDGHHDGGSLRASTEDLADAANLKKVVAFASDRCATSFSVEKRHSLVYGDQRMVTESVPHGPRYLIGTPCSFSEFRDYMQRSRGQEQLDIFMHNMQLAGTETMVHGPMDTWTPMGPNDVAVRVDDVAAKVRSTLSAAVLGFPKVSR
jgi:hypothetical protein